DIPPSPTIGIFTARAAWYTMRKATGLIDGPDSPPVTFHRRGLRVSISMAMPTKEFISGDALALVEDLETPNIIFRGIGKYVYDAARPEGAQKGELFSKEAPCPDVLKADGIEHSG